MQRSKCDPYGEGQHLAMTRYYLRAALAAIRGEPFGYCHVVPSRRGWDDELERWRPGFAFCSAVDGGWSCRGEVAPVDAGQGPQSSISEPVVA